MATTAPSAARRFAIAAPIPREPPVTSATFLVNLDMELLCFSWLVTQVEFSRFCFHENGRRGYHCATSQKSRETGYSRVILNCQDCKVTSISVRQIRKWMIGPPRAYRLEGTTYTFSAILFRRNSRTLW